MQVAGYLFTMIKLVLAIVGMFFTSLITWIFSKRKTKAEADQAEGDARAKDLDNFQKSIDIYRGMAEDLGKQVNNLLQELSATRQENANLRVAMQSLREENVLLKQKMAKLEKKLDELNNKTD